MCVKCMICQENEATKTNSHVIPSFLVTMFTSYNGSGKRDTEVLFSISDTKDSVYTGRAVPDTKLEGLFDTEKLTEELITAKRKAHTFKNEMCFPQTKTKCELKKHSNSKFECFFVILIE